MAENNTKISQKKMPVRLPVELRKELRTAAYERGQQTGVEPSFGDLLAEAWETAKSIAKSGYSAVTKTGAPSALAPTGKSELQSESLLNIAPREYPLVRKLLAILRARRPHINVALEHNLDAFKKACDDAAELEGLKSAGISAPNAGGGDHQAIAGNIEGAAGNRGTGGDDASADRALIDRARTIVDHARRRSRRADNTVNKAG